jgi:vacuolar protein sorting-associated protein 54
MHANTGGRKSMDSLSSPTSPHGSRHDFPFHARQGSSNALQIQRRGSTASSIHSIGGALDSSSGSWGNAVVEAGQNGMLRFVSAPGRRRGRPYNIC